MEKRDYSEFRNIEIFNIGLLDDNAINRRYLNKNGIKTLEDLFEKDDRKEIIWGNASKAANINSIISLARYKYLNEDLYFGLGVNIEKKYKKEEWFTKEPTGQELVNRKLVRNITGLGFSISYLLYQVKDMYDEEFSIEDILTNEEIITNLNKSKNPQWFKNCFNLVSNYVKEKKIKTENLDATTNMSDILEEEKRLIKELEKLKEQSAILEKRISEIQLLKQNTNSERRI